jgi:hypothetical protein
MKKFLLFFVAVVLLTTSFATTGTRNVPAKKATEIYLVIGKNGEQISLMNLTQISVKDYQTVSGRHLTVFEKAAFKLSQRKLAKCINTDGSINNKKLLKLMDDGDHSTGFHLGGFALGFLLGLIGVLLAYVVNDNENKPNRVKWAWIGFGIFVVLYIALLIAVL